MSTKQQPASGIIKPPQFAKKTLTRTNLDGLLRSQERYSDLLLLQESFANQVAEHLSFEAAQLKQVDLSGTRLSHLELLDVQCSDCNFANAGWLPAIWQRVEALSCQLTGLVLSEAGFQDVLFKECKCTFAQFRFANFKRVRFDHCDLSEADFQGADLSGVSFVNCNLSHADMSKARLQGVDLRSSQIEGLRAGAQELQGAIIQPAQAVALVQALGIVVEQSI